jgi:hypothetical protein
LYQTHLIAKHLTVIPAFVWTISSEQQHWCTTSMIIYLYRWCIGHVTPLY